MERSGSVIEVKLSTNFPTWPLLRQTPRGSGEWGNCRFVLNREVDACDFWVVLDGLSRPETTRCHSANTLLVTCEPPNVKGYTPRFVRQFGAVLTSHRTIEHPQLLIGQQGLPWMIGAQMEPTSRTWSNFMSYEDIENYSAKKDRLVSIVAAKGKWTPGHAARDRFIEELKKRLGERVEVFGMGHHPITDKLNAVGPYRYHIAVENSRIPDYWTEKLADAYLGRAFPIYSGCPNLDAYFPAGSYEAIDIGNPAVAVERVREIVASNIDLDRQRIVEDARRKVLHEYNVFAVLDSLINRLRQTDRGEASPLTLYPDASAPDQRPARSRNAAIALLARYARRWRT